MSVLDDVNRAIAIRASFPRAHSLELLDLVFEGHIASAEECASLGQEHAVEPQTLAFIASAFDQGMTEHEWRMWQGPSADPRLQAAVRSLWREFIVPAFTARYSGTDRPAWDQSASPRDCSNSAL